MNFLHILEHHLLDHPAVIYGMAIPTSMHRFMLIVAGVSLVLSIPLLARNWPLIPTGRRNFLETFVVFIRDEVVMPNMGEEGLKYLPYFLSLFFFILTLNLLGLIPGFATATGNISVTATLALCTFVLINFAGIREYGFFHHMKNFIPHGLPGWLVPLMLPLEIVGLLTKSFALCIRLFANMIAGHIVILGFLSLIFILGHVLVAVPSVGVSVCITLLEIFVSFLQAYIFTFLTSIFVGASLHPH